jgi:hypothetical protein
LFVHRRPKLKTICSRSDGNLYKEISEPSARNLTNQTGKLYPEVWTGLPHKGFKAKTVEWIF